MPRNYPLPLASPRSAPASGVLPRALLRVAGLAAASLAGLQAPVVHSADLFAAQPLDAGRFAILARPVGREDWNLLVLEQLAASPSCWTARPDGLVDPSLNRFNFTGVCNRYIDSNGYSLRIGEQDLASSYRLRLVQVGDELRLQASSVANPTDLLVGRGKVPLRDRDGFVMVTLESGWSLQRRTYQDRALSHLYFANGESLPVLLARFQPQSQPQPGGAPAAGESGSTLLSRLGSLGSTREEQAGVVADRGPVAIPGQPVPLQVIPFRE